MSTAEIIAAGAASGAAFAGGLTGIKGNLSVYSAVSPPVAPAVTAPSAALVVTNPGGGVAPIAQLTMQNGQGATPTLATGGPALQISSTTFTAPATQAACLITANPAVPSAPLTYPVGSYYGFLPPAGSGAAGAAGLIAGGQFVNNTCVSITAKSVVKCWLLGATQAAFAAAGGIVPPVVTIQPGAGFTLTTASNGATYGYEVSFA